MTSSQFVRARAKPFAAACIAAGMGAALLFAGPARAEEHMTLLDMIEVGGKGLGAFDISFVDPTLNLYVVSDRTNASVDFIDTATNTLIGRAGGFRGVVLVNGKADNSLSGPDGVVIIQHKTVWAGDGNSTVKVIDLATMKVVDTIPTHGKFRADEMSWDARDHILAVANNADTPPFLTMINTDTHKVLGRITFDGNHNTPDATNGLEQSQWSPATGMFYVSVPQVGPGPADGGVAVINPTTMQVVATFLVDECTPAGLTLGPQNHALLGCSASFGTSPHVITQTIVVDITDGEIVANIPQVGGSDEVWYDRGSNHYYLGARSHTDHTGTVTPILGVVDADTNTFDPSPVTSTTAHSVAADSNTGHVFVPIGFVPPTAPPGTDPTNPCPRTGCIAVYVPSGQDVAGGGDAVKEASR
jgi:hypothetical protein